MKIPIVPITIDSSTSHHDGISLEKSYFARIYGRWYFGRFSKQWYGWSFHNWGSSGIQLNHYEADISALDTRS